MPFSTRLTSGERHRYSLGSKRRLRRWPNADRTFIHMRNGCYAFEPNCGGWTLALAGRCVGCIADGRPARSARDEPFCSDHGCQKHTAKMLKPMLSCLTFPVQGSLSLRRSVASCMPVNKAYLLGSDRQIFRKIEIICSDNREAISKAQGFAPTARWSWQLDQSIASFRAASCTSSSELYPLQRGNLCTRLFP